MMDLNEFGPSSTYDLIFHGLPANFNSSAIALFRKQFGSSPVYHAFASRFVSQPRQVQRLTGIPFLPVSFFKSELLKTSAFEPEIIFTSSGTTGTSTARHAVKSLDLYRESFVKGFHYFYGDPRGYCILSLLPSYLERTGSSLVLMADELMRLSGHKESGFYLQDVDRLHHILSALEKNRQRTILLGVAFALLDFSESYPFPLRYTTVMETGGMKGRRKEITRAELHDILKARLGLTHVHSEYGMTELLSQAYSSGEGIFKPVPWMKMLVRDEDDPLHVRETGEGLLNIIDLANQDSCGFIATDDVARIYEDGSFEILGRMDNSDIRGCSLMVV